MRGCNGADIANVHGVNGANMQVGKCKVWTNMSARNTGPDTTTRGIRYNGRPMVKAGATPCMEVCTSELERSLRASPIHAPSSGLRTVRHNGVFTRHREDDVSEGIILSVMSTQKLRFHSVSKQMGLRSMQSSLSAGSADGAVAEQCSVDDSGSAQYGVHAQMTLASVVGAVGQHKGHDPCRRCRQATRVTHDASGCHMTLCSNGVDIMDCADHFRRVLSLLDAVRGGETKTGATGDGGYNTQQRRRRRAAQMMRVQVTRPSMREAPACHPEDLCEMRLLGPY
ncbi:hypothetical protein C8R45DRAFT_1162556 [Mycena sanguinolenta]|nr:hypothetical protein C8R45DRAFT_1162556 [Mycena sanguinolenta]